MTQTQTPEPDDDEPTDWPAFAADMLSGDPERIKQHLPSWLRDIVDPKP